jgi:hypothetical protein
MASTDVELVEELKKHERTNPVEIRLIIQKAKKGHYHDLKSNMVLPKIALIRELRSVNLTALADRVIGGEFDERFPAADGIIRKKMADDA